MRLSMVLSRNWIYEWFKGGFQNMSNTHTLIQATKPGSRVRVDRGIAKDNILNNEN